MKKARVIILMMVMVLMAKISFAGNVNNNVSLEGLTEQQKLEFLQKLETAKAEKASGTDQAINPAQIAEWLKVGKEVASLVPVFAKETCIGAQQVLDSKPGRILLGIVLVRMFWGKLVGILLFAFGLTAWWHVFKSVFIIKDVQYTPHSNSIMKWFGFRQKTVTRNEWKEIMDKFNDNFYPWIFLIAGLIILVAGIIAVCN